MLFFVYSSLDCIFLFCANQQLSVSKYLGITTHNMVMIEIMNMEYIDLDPNSLKWCSELSNVGSEVSW